MSDLPTIKKVLSLPIDEVAVKIESELAHNFHSVLPGLYLPGQETPLICSSVKYRMINLPSQDNDDHDVFIHSVDDIRGPIYLDDELVIAPHDRRLKYLRTIPTVPVFGRWLVRKYLDDFVYYQQAWRRYDLKLSGTVKNHFPQYKCGVIPGACEFKDTRELLVRLIPVAMEPTSSMVNDCLEIISEACMELRTDVLHFTGGITWDMLTLVDKVGHGVVHVENYGDFRIHDWEQRLGSCLTLIREKHKI